MIHHLWCRKGPRIAGALSHARTVLEHHQPTDGHTPMNRARRSWWGVNAAQPAHKAHCMPRRTTGREHTLGPVDSLSPPPAAYLRPTTATPTRPDGTLMPNQHTMTIRLTDATERQLLMHIASRMETHMSDMTAALDHLTTSLAKEIADIRDDLMAQVDSLSSVNAELRDALAAKVGELDGAIGRVKGMASELDANDAPAPEPAPEPEPAPVDPTPVDPTPVDPAPVDPTDPTTPDTPVDPAPEQPTP